jgi:DNA-binding CsgD family transcriptional regulator
MFAAVLNRSTVPLFVVGPGRELLFSNTAGQRILGSSNGFKEHEGLLHTGEAETDNDFEALLASTSNDARRVACQLKHSSRGLRVRRKGAGVDWLLVIHALGVVNAAGKNREACLVQAIGRKRPRSIPSRVLHDCFDLTRREAAVLTVFAQVGTAQMAAKRLFLSHETVRTHLKRVFRKCGVHSKEEVLALVNLIAMFCGTDAPDLSRREHRSAERCFHPSGAIE